ncbi:MAG: hypothetical protein COB33_012640 [Thiotrichaceae bacterium]|nr:hypothetical protein [Thiotrichaceae bacterium]
MPTDSPDIQRLAEIFSDLGGTFVTPPSEIAARLKKIKAIVFDWDGVFNDGFKGEGLPSIFSEADSMGTNMLRYGLWRQNSGLPITAIISGEQNLTARHFATREHFHHVYLGIPDKREALAHLCATQNINPENVAFVFDDVNDLGMAAQCGLRLMVHRKAGPLLHQYAIDNNCCDYISANGGSNHAVREAMEFMLGFIGDFDAVIGSRTRYDDEYKGYFEQRQRITTQNFKIDANRIVAAD